MIIDLEDLDIEEYEGGDPIWRTESRITAVVRSNDGLEGVELRSFMIRITGEGDHLAYFKLPRWAWKTAYTYPRQGTDVFL